LEDAPVFTLKIPVTPTSLDAIKAELTRTLSAVKSSHRCEAIARGLGFHTYAAIRAATQSPDPIIGTVEAAAFNSYLAEHGFEVSALPFYGACVRVALRAVMKKVPTLTAFGIGIGDPRRNADGSRESALERESRFTAGREELLDDQLVEPFLLSLAMLARIEPTKTFYTGTSSYGLKHVAERYACTYPDGTPLGPQYVTNGIFIAAAVHAGFDIKTYKDARGSVSPNVSFNMSKRSLAKLGA
jgi:hypothetical protein